MPVTPTPIRRQYLRIKREHADAILLFRLGDFYETFDDDAELLARVLEITLTSREMGKGQRVPLAGIPYHSLESYLPKLVRAGHKVAICEQVGAASDSRTLVDREVVRVITPGTLVEDSLLDGSANNYLVALIIDQMESGLAYVDISTGEFATTQFSTDQLKSELERLSAAEILVPHATEEVVPSLSAVITTLESGFEFEEAYQVLIDHFGVSTLEPYGCQELPLAIQAAGSIIAYLNTTQKASLDLIQGLATYSVNSYMALDHQTRRNLELFQEARWGGTKNSLITILDVTDTSMGTRLLRRWLGQPLLNLQPLLERQNAVQRLYENTIQRQQVRNLLHKMPDLERLLSRVVSGVASPRDLVALRSGLELLPKLEEVLGLDVDFETNQWSRLGLGTFPTVVTLIANALFEDPGMIVGEGRVIRPGFSKELDDFRFAANDAREYLASLERREQERTGILSLKVGYNRVFGYYLEVSNANIHRVPEEYIRRQTLVGGERFITPELKEYESKVLSAREKMEGLEQILYRQVSSEVAAEAAHILTTATGVAHLDVLASLAEIAIRNDYVKPDLNEGNILSIKDGRHPVVEQTLQPGTFVTNDTNLDNDDVQLMMLTGPNMSGKSTYIRQVALIVLMAQIGSYVPAREAVIGLVDRVFTRVGLQDDLVTGQSTFMVEMVETAAILHNATQRSLVVLDEIGRGTSTYDGLAIAWAVAEYLHDASRLGCKTLFATHYHELVELAKTLTRVGNYNVAVVEEEEKVIFLHRILPGATGRSYGVHVAKLAGLPKMVTTRAREILSWLEDVKPNGQKKHFVSDRHKKRTQLPLFEPRNVIVDDLLNLDLSTITPLEALNKLSEIQDQLRGR